MLSIPISYNAPQLLEQGVLSGAQSFSQGLSKALQKYEEDKKQREFNTGMLDTFKGDSNLSKFVPQDALLKWDSMNGDKQAGVLAGVARRAQSDYQQQQLQMQESIKNAQTDEASARANLLWAQGNDAWSGMSPDQQQLQLTPDEQGDYQRAGKIPVRTSAKTFQAVDMPETPTPPKLDKDGNPMFTPDGTMYMTEDGKMKPVTGPMMQAKTVFDALRKTNESAAQKAQDQHGFNVFDTSTWFGSSGQQQKAGQGGYIPGRRYAGKLYTGGDPNDPNNWQQ